MVKDMGSAGSPTGMGMDIRIANCSFRGHLQRYLKGAPHKSTEFKVVFDLDDHTKYHVQLPGGHFRHRHFSSDVPQIFVWLHFASN